LVILRACFTRASSTFSIEIPSGGIRIPSITPPCFEACPRINDEPKLGKGKNAKKIRRRRDRVGKWGDREER
jgi:hypothetical protein